MTTLAIIAAGNGTRMGNISGPKALFPIHGIPNLEYNLTSADALYDEVIVFVRHSDVHLFEEYREKYNRIFEIISISSGLGDGHAILQALPFIKSNDITILWGDAHINSSNIFSELLEYSFRAPILFPSVSEHNPYVTIITDNEMNVLAADFSKLNERHEFGLHDQSIFRIKKEEVFSALSMMHSVMWKNGRYISESHELNFLHCFHYLKNAGYPAKTYITEHKVQAYNTIQEVNQIEKE